MHSLGGIILGLMGIILLRRVPLLQNLTSTQKIIWVILCGLLGGIAWEAFEYVQDVYLHTAMQISLRDTLTDIVADTLGAAMVGIVYWLKNKL